MTPKKTEQKTRPGERECDGSECRDTQAYLLMAEPDQIESKQDTNIAQVKFEIHVLPTSLLPCAEAFQTS